MKKKLISKYTNSVILFLVIFILIIANNSYAGGGLYAPVCKTEPFGASIVLDNSWLPTYSYFWYGPFGMAEGYSPEVSIQEGLNTISQYVDLGDTSYFSSEEKYVNSCFTIIAEAGRGSVKISGDLYANAEKYAIFRSDETNPKQLVKIVEGLPSNQNSFTYTDKTVQNEKAYLYVTAALVNGTWFYSNVIAAFPSTFKITDRPNALPIIYSSQATEATVGIEYTSQIRAIDPDSGEIITSCVLEEFPEGMVEYSLYNYSICGLKWTPTAPGSYPVTVRFSDGADSVTESFTIEVGSRQVPVSVQLNANPLIVESGQKTVLSWESAYANSCSIDNGIGTVFCSNSKEVTVQEDTTFTITASILGNVVTDTVTVKVKPAVSINAEPKSIIEGGSSTLSWTSNNANTVSIDQGIGEVALDSSQGGVVVTPSSTTTYTITATGSDISSTDSVEVEVYPEIHLQVASPVDGFQTTSSPLNVSGQVSEGASVTVNGINASVENNNFSVNIPLTVEGQNAITIVATDSHGQEISEVRNVTYSYPELSLQIDSPVDGISTTTSPLAVTGHVSNNASVTVNGISATVTGDTFNGSVSFSSPGQQTVTVNATDSYNQQVTKSVGVTYSYPQLTLQVDSPADGTYVRSPNITVTGSVSNNAHVTVNGTGATVSDGTFSASLTLESTGQHTITVIAIDDFGQQKTSSLSVNYAPELVLDITAPSDNAIIYKSPLHVTGQVTNNATVTVNGISATVNGTTYSADIPLQTEGPQSIVVNATDTYGQQKSATINIVYSNVPTVTLSADKYNITSGEAVLLTWTSENCDNAVLDPGSTSVDCAGSLSVFPGTTTKYSVNATGLEKTVQASVIIVVDASYGDPTAEEQAHLEAINRARANPLAEAARLGIDLNEGPPSLVISDQPVPPLRFNKYLNQAARSHTQEMVDNLFYSHNSLDGSNPYDRCTSQGYVGEIGENISARYSTDPLDALATALGLHDDLFIDAGYPGRGHRINILTASYKEIGIGFLPESNSESAPYGGVITCDFGNPADGAASLVGVVYEDSNSNQIYDVGEGLNNVLIQDLASGDVVYTAGAGGYSLPLANGDHTIKVMLPDGRTLSRAITMSGSNIKLDFLVSMFATTTPSVSLRSSDPIIKTGNSTTLYWESSDSDYAEIDNGIGSVPVNGSISVSPATTTTYTITSFDVNGNTATSSATVYVSDYATLPSVTFSASPQSVSSGQSATLSWTSTDAQHLFIDNGIGEVPINSSITVTPEHSTTYTLTATSQAGVVNARVRVAVTGSPAQQPKGSYGYLYNQLIPADATVDKYDSTRFAMITGKVLDRSDLPVAGVQVTILDYPEYGTVFTNENGQYNIPVEGGRTLTVSLQKTGYLPAQRQVITPVNDAAVVDTVQLLNHDEVSSEVIFDGNPATIITHKSSVISDTAGERSITMVFQGDNRAFVVDENGKDVKEITSFTTRATEYQTAKSMPAELPKNSEFTYCAEIEADGVDRIRFEKPVVTWLDNFLGFDVGFAIPAGYYDRDKGVWVASENGVVVKLLDTDSDGIVDAVDKDGDNTADDLDNDGNIHDEAIGLSDPTQYKPGETYWRVEVTHFTPWDYNFCSSKSLVRMLGIGKPSVDGATCTEGCSITGSGVRNESLIFYEDIPIPGTELSLHYATDRTKGYKNVITVPVSGTEVPDSVKRIKVQVSIGGQLLEKELEPLPNQVTEFVWDGTDWLGNPLHEATAFIQIGFVYDSYYMDSGYLAMAFGGFGATISSVPTRDEVILWQHSNVKLNLGNKFADIAEGWSLSAHHQLVPTDPSTLFKGNGAVVQNALTTMSTIAGSGEAGWPLTGQDAKEAPLVSPTSAAIGPDGNLYVANQVYPAVIRIDENNQVEVVAGGLYGTSDEDGIEGTAARLPNPYDIAFDTKGNLYIADYELKQIKKLDTDGIITTVAGTGNSGSTGDGSFALSADIMPTSIAVDDFGNIYFGESGICKDGTVNPVTGACQDGTLIEGKYKVRKISTNGIISTVAGTGEKYDADTHGSNGDGGPAAEAYLSDPASVSVDREGNLYIADGARIRMVNTSGIISTVAGTGSFGYTGDGGLATEAQITRATGIAFDKNGNYYFSQCYGNGDVVRKVTSNGYISTVVGTGIAGFAGDDGLAAKAQLLQPKRLVVDPNGFLIIPDSGNGRIRKAAIDGYSQEDVHFAESSGVGHLITKEGYHSLTFDLETGIPLLSFEYDDDGYLTGIVDQFNNRVQITRSAGVPSTIISPDGLVTNLTIDSSNQLQRIMYADGSYHSFEYQNNDGLLTAKTEPNGNQFDHYFDELGRVYETHDQNGGIWQFERTKSYDGSLTSLLTTPNTTQTTISSPLFTGETTREITTATGEVYTEDTSSDGLQTVSESTCGPKVETTRDLDTHFGFSYTSGSKITTPAGLILQSTLAREYTDDENDGLLEAAASTTTVNGKSATTSNDIVHSTIVTTSPENRVTTAIYDPDTLQITSFSIPGLNDTTYTYRSDGKIEQIATGTRHTSYSYYTDGNLESVTDSMNRVTRFTAYDEVGRVTRVLRPDNSVLEYNYDENGNLTLYRTPIPANNSFEYNGINKRSLFASSLGSTTSYAYNAERQLTKITLPSSKEIVNTYNLGRLMRTDTSEWTNIYTYGCGDLVDTISRGAEVINNDYDGNLVTSITQTGTINAVLGFGYNNDFRLASMTYAGQTTTYGYDNDGLLITAGAYAISRNVDNGLPVEVSNSNATLSRSFNGYGEIDTENLAVFGNIFSYDLTRYTDGRIETKTETVAGTSSTFAYTYDALGRLLTVNKDDNLVEEYQYDENGNRTYQTNTLLGFTGRTFSYSDEDHLLVAGTITYEFDYDDRLSARIEGTETIEYNYSSTGELLQVKLADGTIISYVHDPLGRRIAKKVGSYITERYLWSGQTTLLAVYDGSGNLLQRFEYADSRMPVAMNQNGSTYYLAYDQVGSLRVITDASGNTVKQIEYDSFGNITSDSNPTFTIPFGFAGGLHDRDTHLVRFGYRDYMPEIGRWTAKDPIDFAGGDSNLFGYVNNDPVNFVDPTGQFFWVVAGAFIGGGMNVAAQLYSNGGNWGAINLGQVGWSALSGALGGGLGTLTSSLGSGLLNVAANAIGSAAISGGIAAAQNALNPCHKQSVGKSALMGTLFGGGGASLGNFVSKGYQAFANSQANAAWESASLTQRLWNSSNAISNASSTTASAVGASIGNSVSNIVGNLNQ